MNKILLGCWYDLLYTCNLKSEVNFCGENFGLNYYLQGLIFADHEKKTHKTTII